MTTAGDYNNDDLLADALENGAPGAEIAYCDRFRTLLMKWAVTRRFGLEDAEDLAQETLLIGWQKIKSFIRGGALASWLVGIEEKLILRRYEQDDRVRTALNTLAVIPRTAEVDSKNAADLLARVELHLAVMNNKTYAQAVRHRYFDLMTFDQVAGALGLSSAQVAREYVRRGLRKLKAMDAEAAPEEPTPGH